MNRSNRVAPRHALPFLAFSIFASASHASCGTDFCSINTQWDTQGLANTDGLGVDLRYSQAQADQLRAGSTRISPPTPSGSDEEIEDKRTRNRLLHVAIDYAVDQRWNVALQLPVVMREHSHTFDSSISGPFRQQAKFSELGDVRLIGKYKFGDGSLNGGSGIRFGLKLPTGAIDKTMTPRDPANPTTPYKLERSSQPGSGSTDVVLGLYRYGGSPASNWGWFASGEVQAAAAIRDDYRPGRQVNLDLGLSYAFNGAVSGTVQLNAKHRARDTGNNANLASGGHSVNLSPGLVYTLTPQTRIYGFVQRALNQHVNTDPADPASGQLTAPGSIAVGLSRSF